MKRKCPVCELSVSECFNHGYFIRKSDGRMLVRYKCRACLKTFSDATTQACYRQKKRRLNPRIYELLCSGVSQRRISRLLHVRRRTVERKLLFLSQRASLENRKSFKAFECGEEVQFDDLETIEHTKCKPLSVAMAVDKDTRRILGFKVSQMPAKGHLAKIARKKYGPRRDKRLQGWNALFSEISGHINSRALVIRSDENPHYVNLVKKWCPAVRHLTTPGGRSCVAGQGELKKKGFDPLFSLNHTFAMLRANINRLIRKTWCTTKRPDRLEAHLELYMNFHNKRLIAS